MRLVVIYKYINLSKGRAWEQDYHTLSDSLGELFADFCQHIMKHLLVGTWKRNSDIKTLLP